MYVNDSTVFRVSSLNNISLLQAWDDYTVNKPSGYFVGATCKFRSSHYTFASRPITTHTRNPDGSAHFTVSEPYYGGTEPGYGYWLEGIFTELDTAGEWFHNTTSNSLYLWSPNSDSPSTHTIEIVVETSALSTLGAKNVEVRPWNRLTQIWDSW